MARTREQPAGQPVKQQPRDISPEVAVQSRYKAGMHLELQKFGDYKGARQLLLSEAMGGEELAQGSPISVTGLDLTPSEDRALSALQILLDRTDYQGNMPGHDNIDRQAWKWTGDILPRLSTSYSDYFEAYGLKPTNGRYQGHQRAEALEALESLAKPRRIVYERKRWEEKGKGRSKGRRQVSDIIVTVKPLIGIVKGYKGLEQEEADQVKAGQEMSHRVTSLVIDIGPLLMDGLDNFFLLKPTTLHQEIKALLGSRPVSRAVSLFIEWLLTKNLPEIAIGKERLAKQLRLDYLLEQRHQGKIQKRLLEAIQTAQELGYLLKWEEDALGCYHFTLNPDRMGRPPKWQLKAGEEEEEEDEEAGSLPE